MPFCPLMVMVVAVAVPPPPMALLEWSRRTRRYQPQLRQAMPARDASAQTWNRIPHPRNPRPSREVQGKGQHGADEIARVCVVRRRSPYGAGKALTL
jgi:hypothetical protein